MYSWKEFSLSPEQEKELKPQIDKLIPLVIASVRAEIEGHDIATETDLNQALNQDDFKALQAAMQKVGFDVFVDQKRSETFTFSKKADPKKLDKFMLSIPKEERKAFREKIEATTKELLELSEDLKN